VDGRRPRPAWIAPVPNVLTALRIALALALPFVPERAYGPVVVAAGLSDFLDGWIARRFHATSDLGALLDGVADKLFVLSAVLTLVLGGAMPWWQGAAVMSRDLVVAAIALRFALARAWGGFRRMKVRLAGKLTTAIAFLWFVSLLVAEAEPARLPLFVLAAAASAAAAADYVLQFVRLRRRVSG
jgi:phosphatidylglycerophosphate synthase